MAILVTGGSGFVGRRIVETLLKEGQMVLALSRSTASDAFLADLGAKPVRGDLLSTGLVLPPVEAVVHAAAYFRLAGPRQPYFDTNVEGTKRLLAASKRAGAKSFIHISAGAVIMDDKGTALSNADETMPTFAQSRFPYIASKAAGEAAVLAAHSADFRTICLRPPAIWGKGDAFSASLPTMLARRQFGFINKGAFPYSTCHVDNVVEAVLCALNAQTGGQAFFIQDPEPTTFRGFVVDVAKQLGLDASRAPSMPYGLANRIGGMMDGLWSLAGARHDPPISRTMVRLIGREFTISDAAARRALGYAGKRTRAEGLAAY